MPFGHEQLDVYKLAIKYVAWVYQYCDQLQGHRSAKDQILRASQSIPLNIAEGNGKATHPDRRKFFEIARGSSLECAAVQDVFEVCGVLSAELNKEKKNQLDRIVAMLTRMGGRGYTSVREEAVVYNGFDGDTDSDTDSDTDTDTDSDSDTDSDM